MSFYEVKVVNRASPHAVITTFQVGGRELASVDSITWALNEPGSFAVTVPVHHAAASSIVALQCELQVWRNGTLIAWGVPLQPSLNGGAWTWTCPGLLWYLTRRVFGPITVNYLTNPNFLVDLTGWTSVNVVSGTRSTAIPLRGAGTLRLVTTSSGDSYAQHTFNVNTGGVGLVLFFAGWYWIDPATPFTAPALEERGLYIDSPNCLPDSQPSWDPITMNTPIGVPTRLETALHLPANLTNETVTVRLYSPHAAIHWGALTVNALDSVSSEPGGTDVTEMMRRIVAYAHVAYNYNFATSTPAAGATEIVAYQYADLGNVFDALATYPARGLADFEVVLTSATSRTFTTYAPRKGTLKSANGLVVPGTKANLAGFRLDGQQTATRKIVRGSGDGPDRELGVATDTSTLSGLVLDDVSDAPPETSINDLDRYAATELARLSKVVELADFDIPAEGWVGVVGLGDTVPVTIDWGAVQVVAGTRRLVSMTLDPATDRVSPGLNVV